MENEAGVPSVGWEQDAILVGADDVSEFNEDIVLPQSPEVIARIRKWLQPTMAAIANTGSTFHHTLRAQARGCCPRPHTRSGIPVRTWEYCGY
jgi:hypothetical protein